ncbi:hypothetical protein FACS189454_06500 [Planctomycetales bacterium]|nr:hypothetical protein FACS189454_06500 [Planctomycetales bacterium]
MIAATVKVPAQEIGYGGVGAINHSFAGATAALPLDGNGAMYWNPATIGSLEQGEVQIGFSRINAPWYGDESLAYTLIVPAAALWLCDIVYDDISKPDKHLDEPPKTENEDKNIFHVSKGQNGQSFPKVRGLNVAFVMPPDDNRRWNIGFALAENGSRQFHFVQQDDEVFAQLYRVKNLEFTPTVSWRFNERLHIGFSPMLSITEFPAASFPVLTGYERRSETEHCGFGLQLGAFYQTKRKVNFGLSLRSPHWTTAQTIQWFDSNGNILERKIHYSTEFPTRYVFGVSYTGFEKWKLASDIRVYDFQHLRSFYRVTNHSVPKTAMSYSAGLQFKPNRFWILRCGYQFTDAVSGAADYWDNTALPLAKGHSIHYGVSAGKLDDTGLDVSLSLSHSFGGGTVNVQTESGVQSFKRQPNTSLFCWNVRWRF